MFTPVVRDSAIGRMAALVTRALLNDGHNVGVVATESDDVARRGTHAFGVPVVPWTSGRAVEQLLAESDIAVYQIGDYVHFHEGGLDWLFRVPGVVCLHDFYLGDLFSGWADKRPDYPADRTLRAWYGNDAADAFRAARASHRFIELTRETMPLTEWVCSAALAVVTHSHWGIDRVLRSCPGPVRVADLAYDHLPHVGPHDDTPHGPSFKLLTIGHINGNKRVRSVIKAVGASEELRGRVEYRLVGLIEPLVARHLSALAHAHDVNLVISGAVDDAALSAALAAADVVVALRWPALESASASAIEAMLSGKATIVTRSGATTAMPDDCVVKIDPQDEVGELRRALERLMRDPADRAALGKRAAARAAEAHDPARYAAHLVEIATQAREVRLPLDLIDYIAGALGEWGAEPATLDQTLLIDPIAALWANAEPVVNADAGPR